MAEGGIAAAMANVDDRDSWRVHFADTMRGGQYLNNWRMAELHAKEAPDRVRELEAWGALFDRTAMAAFCNAILAGIVILGWRTWAIAPAWR
jgi:succinate dehydrogenase/fumarate reductase flavoprotein subunit